MKYAYDLLVIGGGSGGLTAAIGGAQIGAKTMLVEKEKIGGDCTHAGCIPSKTLIKAGKMAQQCREMSQSSSSLKEVLSHVEQTVSSVYAQETPEAIGRHGVSVRMDTATFLDDHTVRLSSGEEISARFIVIATGSRAKVPPIEGLSSTSYLTNEEIFKVDAMHSLSVIGGGPIGAELAEAFTHLGVKVNMIETNDRIMKREDREASLLVQDHLHQLGVGIYTYQDVISVSEDAKQQKHITIRDRNTGETNTLSSDALLVAVGREPNVEGLGLDTIGVNYDRRGICIDKRSRTNKKHIFAVGDVARTWQFTHYANHMGKVALMNLLFRIPATLEQQVIPRVTYTTPEVASVGIQENEIQKQHSYLILRKSYEEIDRAITDNNHEGFMKLIVDKRGYIKGATLVGCGAGELIGEVSLAMKQGIPVTKLADTIHPYPTYGYGLRTLADQFRAQGYTPRKRRLVKRLFGLRGDV